MANHVFRLGLTTSFFTLLSSCFCFNTQALELPHEVETMLANLEKGLNVYEIDELGLVEEQFGILQSTYRNQIEILRSESEYMEKEKSKLAQKGKMHKKIVSKKEELMKRTNKLNEKIHRLNMKQLQKLQQRIKMAHFLESNQRNQNEPVQEEAEEKYTVPNPSSDDYVTIDELEDTWNSIFDANQPWEQDLQLNVEKIMDIILDHTFSPTIKQQEQYMEQFSSETESLEEQQPSCVNKKQLKSMIYETIYPSLVQSYHDFIPDAQIIHSKSYTSPTFSSSKVSYLFSLFGNIHTEIQNKNTNLGHCWPMDMTTNSDKKEGQITFLFPYPINVRAIAIHHVSPLILSDEQRRIGTGSAPRLFQIKGFSPCDAGSEFADRDCQEGFDEEDNWTVLSGEYVWGGGVVQYFPVGNDGSTSVENNDTDDEETIEDIESFDSGFSASAGSCTMPPDADLGSDDFEPSCGGDDDSLEDENKPVQAITLVIEDNAGHQDYTCLYRLQVFGEEV